MRWKDESGVRLRDLQRRKATAATTEFYLSYRDEMLALTWRIGQI
jgi:hypothetical protein